MIELRQLRHFVAVAEELHFGRAAARLNIVQPAVTRSIQKIEEQLGVLLFDRQPREILLTYAGKTLLQRARSLIEQTHLTESATIRAASGETAPFRLGYVGLMAYDLLPRVIDDFRRHNPEIHLTTEEGLTEALIPKLRDGTLDFAMVNGVREGISAEEINSVTIEELPISVFVPVGSQFTQTQRLKLSDLAGENFIGPPPVSSPAYHRVFMDACAAAGFSPKIVMELPRMHLMLDLVARGIGIAVLPDYSHWLRMNSVVAVPLHNLPKTLNFSTFIAWPKVCGSAAVEFSNSIRRCIAARAQSACARSGAAADGRIPSQVYPLGQQDRPWPVSFSAASLGHSAIVPFRRRDMRNATFIK